MKDVAVERPMVPQNVQLQGKQFVERQGPAKFKPAMRVEVKVIKNLRFLLTFAISISFLSYIFQKIRIFN